MIALLILADFTAAWDASKAWVVPSIAGCVPLFLYWLTRRAVKQDAVRTTATQVEQLYIGEAGKLIATLQDELRVRNVRVGTLEAEREQLRDSLTEERAMFETMRQRHKDTLTFLATAGIKVPDELHL